MVKNVIFAQDVFNKEKCKIASFFADGLSCRLPLDPAVVVKDVNIEVNSVLSVKYDNVSIFYVTVNTKTACAKCSFSFTQCCVLGLWFIFFIVC